MHETGLLGAGASAEADVPTAKSMTDRIVEHFIPDTSRYEWRLLRYAIGGLLYNAGAQGRNPLEGVDVEDLFSVIEFLGQRADSEAAPFVGSWHDFLTRLEQQVVREEVAREERRAADDLRMSLELGRTGPLFSREPYDRRRTEGEEFRKLAGLMLEALAELVVVRDDSKVRHLRPLLGRAKEGGLTLATLNYDNCIELAAQTLDVSLETNVDEWSTTGAISLSPSRVQLLKLHGSINWRLVASRRTDERPIQQEELHEVEWHFYMKEHRGRRVYRRANRPGLLFGAGNKLRPEGPFLSLLRAFSEALAHSSLTTIVGYSFRDPHINAEIARWLNGDVSRRLRVIDPGFEWSSVQFAQELRQGLGSRLEQMDTYAGEGLATAYC